MKTVKQLYDELGQLIKEGYGDTRVIANCEFNITKGNGYYNDFPLCYLKDVYYQSGDIELEFSQEEEFTEENKYKDDNNGWHFVKDKDLPNVEFDRADVTVAYINAYENPCKMDCCFDGTNFIYWDARKPVGWKKADIFGKIYAWKYPEKFPELPKE